MPTCGISEYGDYWWRDRDSLLREFEAHGSLRRIGLAHGIDNSTLSKWWRRLGLEKIDPGHYGQKTKTYDPARGEIDDVERSVLDFISRNKGHAPVEQLADFADVSPKKIREAISSLKVKGYRLGEDEETEVVLTKVVPQADHSYSLSPSLFDGEVLRVGVVSDTHLGANEEALEELHLAYDIFEKEGIREVWHAGDWGTGVGMFRTHHSEAHVHTGPQQAKYLVDHYPQRKNIITRGISGNHDLEGDFGRIGFDPVAAMAAERPDIDYLGEYGAWVELRPETGSWLHLLHGSGGMSYAYSYKAQKLVDGYPAGRKPNLLIVGHWHVQGSLRPRNVHVMFPGCFEWQSRFMQRLGLQPAVGFHILEMTVADDGSIVRFKPEWFPYYAGRTVLAA